METLRLLVTDDEEGMRRGVVRALRNFTVSLPDLGGEVGFVVEEAATGEEALGRVAASPPPDILLLDHKLPGASGLEVLDRLAGRPGDMLTVMITAYASLETAVSAIKRGAYDFLAKPFTPEELKDVVRKTAHRLLLARQARRLAEEKRQVRFQLISVLAHELKAPLAAVEGYVRIVRDRAAGTDQATYDHMLDRTLVRTDGMRKLIGDLLDMTRIESGRKRREFAPVDVREAAAAAAEAFAPAARERGIAIDLHAGPPAVLTADRGEIEIILNNLVSNAVKYNRDGGRVDVSIDAAQGAVTVAVADTGIGMTAEEADRIFADFVRIKNERTAGILGSGLGLAIVRKLAALYRGTATVQSRPDAGSTFTVVLREPEPPQEQR